MPGAHPYLVGTVPGTSHRSLLFFNHYDIANYTNPVLPPQPGEREPFSGAIEGDRIYGRGVGDDKATLLSRLHALRAYMAVRGRPPVTVKFLWEGKRHVNSTAFADFLARHHHRVAADWCLWEAGAKDPQERQLISLGHKGHLYVRLRVQALASATSPSRLTALPNAAWRLVWALASLKDAAENVLVPGFRDGLCPFTAAEEALLTEMAGDQEAVRQVYGARAFVAGLSGPAVARYMYAEPTVTICGLESGFTAPEVKLVNPGMAAANVEFRLLPDQDPERLVGQLRRHLDTQGLEDVAFDVLSTVPPYRISADHPLVTLLREVGRAVYPAGTAVVPVASGIGNRYVFRPYTNMPIAGFAVGYAGSCLETPDEHIRVEDSSQS